MEDAAGSSSEDDFKSVSEVNFRKMKEKLTKIGYADGVANGEETGQQIGFNAGLADGLTTAFEIQKYKSLYNLLEHEQLEDSPCLRALLQEKSLYEAMQIPETENKEHCRYLQHKDLTTAEAISQHQQIYVNDLMAECRKRLPQSSQLLQKNENKETC